MTGKRRGLGQIPGAPAPRALLKRLKAEYHWPKLVIQDTRSRRGQSLRAVWIRLGE